MSEAVQCPKCGAYSGDDWSQCNRQCPMIGSPHYNGYVRMIHKESWFAYSTEFLELEQEDLNDDIPF